MTIPFLDPETLMRLGPLAPSLTPGGAPPGVAGPMGAPNAAQPNIPAPPKSMFERVMSRLSPLRHMDPALASLLPPEVRDRSVGDAFQQAGAGYMQDTDAHGNPLSWGQKASNAINSFYGAPNKFAKEQIAQRGALGQMAEQQRIRESRQQMEQAFPAPTGMESAQDFSSRMRAMYDYAVRHGDFEAAKELAAVGKDVFALPPVDNPYVSTSAGDQLFTFDKKTGTYSPGPRTGISDDAKELKRLELESKKVGLREAATRADQASDMRKQALNERAASNFANQNTQVRKGADAYSLVKTHLAEVRHGNPAAYNSMIVAFAGLADPQAQLRQGIIEKISKIDPSVKGRFDLAMQKLAAGKYPARIVDDIEQVVEGIHKEHMATYERRRAARIKQNPDLEDYIPTTETVFGSSYAPNAGETAGGNVSRGAAMMNRR